MRLFSLFISFVISIITLNTPKKKLSIKVSASSGYTVPLGDIEINDDDLIRYARSLAVNSKTDTKLTQ